MAEVKAVKAPEHLGDRRRKQHHGRRPRNGIIGIVLGILLDQDSEEPSLPVRSTALDRTPGVPRVVPKILSASELHRLNRVPALTPVCNGHSLNRAAEERMAKTGPIRVSPRLAYARPVRARDDRPDTGLRNVDQGQISARGTP